MIRDDESGHGGDFCNILEITYRRDPNKSGGGTQLLHAPPTAQMVQSIFSFAVAVDTLGQYNWRHYGDFSISTFNPLKGPNLD